MTADREAGFKALVACTTLSKPMPPITIGRSACAPLRTSPDLSSRHRIEACAQLLRSDDPTPCSLIQSFIQVSNVVRCTGLGASREDPNDDAIASSPSHAVATAVSVVHAACRTPVDRSAIAWQIGGTRRRQCFSKGLFMPVAMRATLSRARDCAVLLISPRRTLSMAGMSPDQAKNQRIFSRVKTSPDITDQDLI